MAVVSMKALLETGVHFGHRTRKWHPRMKSYIFTQRNGIHIIDLQQTLKSLEGVFALVRDTVADGGKLLFVGTKRQAQDTIEVEARRCAMPYVNQRWLGGTLTNWRTIRGQIDELNRLEMQREEGLFEHLTKKEALMKDRRIAKLQTRLGGIREMGGLPGLLYVVDVRREETAVHEANLLKIPVIGIVDTNCDPSKIDYVVPANDDAIRAIKLLTSIMADAVLEGKAMRKDVEEQAVEEGMLPVEELAYEEVSDEELLGESTLAKLKSGAYDEEEKAGAAGEEEPWEEVPEPLVEEAEAAGRREAEAAAGTEAVEAGEAEPSPEALPAEGSAPSEKLQDEAMEAEEASEA
jgi:small subunit ribosomal protein S2